MPRLGLWEGCLWRQKVVSGRVAKSICCSRLYDRSMGWKKRSEARRLFRAGVHILAFVCHILSHAKYWPLCYPLADSCVRSRQVPSYTEPTMASELSGNPPVLRYPTLAMRGVAANVRPDGSGIASRGKGDPCKLKGGEGG